MLSIPDAFAATGTRQSSFTYDAASGLLLSEMVEPNDAQIGVRTTYVYDAFGNKILATAANLASLNSTPVPTPASYIVSRPAACSPASER